MKIDYAITFFYYDDILAVAPFYEGILGFELVQDQKMARVYRVAPNCYFGIVDGKLGHLKTQPKSAALLTISSEDVAGWHAKLKAAGVAKVTEIARGTFTEHFFFEDPAGYALQIQRFRDPAVTQLYK